MVRPYLHSFSSNDIALYHKYAKYFLKRISCGNKVNPDLIHSCIVDLSLKEFVLPERSIVTKTMKIMSTAVYVSHLLAWLRRL